VHAIGIDASKPGDMLVVVYWRWQGMDAVLQTP
jgi:hypothetical protein